MHPAKTKDPCSSHLPLAVWKTEQGRRQGKGGAGSLPADGASSPVSGPGVGCGAGVSAGSLRSHSTVVTRPRGRAQTQRNPRGRLASQQSPGPEGSEGGSQDPAEGWPGGREVRLPGPEQPAGGSQAPLQLPLSLGAGVQGVPQLGQQPGRGAPAAQHPGGPAPRSLPPRSLPGRGSHRREQSAGSMEAAAAPPDLPPPGSPGLSGLEDRPLPAGLPSPEPRAQAPPPSPRPAGRAALRVRRWAPRLPRILT